MLGILKSIMLVSGLILCQCLVSCNNSNTCKLPNGNTTSELLASVSKERNYNYCTLLESALKDNDSSIRELALLDFTDAVGYDHGAVLIEVIQQIGDKKFINAIANTSKEEKNLIGGYLDVGLMYGFRKEYHDKTLREIYPDIYSYLNSN